MATCSFKLLTLKTAFLVEVTSVRRVSEIVSFSMAKEPCKIEDRLVLHIVPSFFPNVNSVFHRFEEVVLPSFCSSPSNHRERSGTTLMSREQSLSQTASFRHCEALFVSFKDFCQGHKVTPSSIS